MTHPAHTLRGPTPIKKAPGPPPLLPLLPLPPDDDDNDDDDDDDEDDDDDDAEAAVAEGCIWSPRQRLDAASATVT